VARTCDIQKKEGEKRRRSRSDGGGNLLGGRRSRQLDQVICSTQTECGQRRAGGARESLRRCDGDRRWQRLLCYTGGLDGQSLQAERGDEVEERRGV